MDSLLPYLGDLYKVLPEHLAGIILVLCSVLCGLMLGAERQAKQKAAGARTLTLICVGSCLFTLASILIAGDEADRTRITAQVVTGVGFLGAGAIIRHRGTVVGLTTGATIWTVSAIGVLVGGGYAAAGIVLTVLVVVMLVAVQWMEHRFFERCRFAHCRIVYLPDHGKTRIRVLRVLDEYRIPDEHWETSRAGDRETIELTYCHFHRTHRALLFEIAEIAGVIEMHRERAPRQAG
ncbi:MAG: MgtC/SapB family protein [Planctomycetota bacterium]